MLPLSSPSHVTTAFKSSWVIDARSLWVAHIWELTFVNIFARFAIERPSHKGRTLASIGPWCIYTSGRGQTVMGTKKTLISVLTRGRDIVPVIS